MDMKAIALTTNILEIKNGKSKQTGVYIVMDTYDQALSLSGFIMENDASDDLDIFSIDNHIKELKQRDWNVVMIDTEADDAWYTEISAAQMDYAGAVEFANIRKAEYIREDAPEPNEERAKLIRLAEVKYIRALEDAKTVHGIGADYDELNDCRIPACELVRVESLAFIQTYRETLHVTESAGFKYWKEFIAESFAESFDFKEDIQNIDIILKAYEAWPALREQLRKTEYAPRFIHEESERVREHGEALISRALGLEGRLVELRQQIQALHDQSDKCHKDAETMKAYAEKVAQW